MKIKNRLPKKGIFLPVFFILLLIAACGGKEGPSGTAPGTQDAGLVYTGSAWPALALLEAGENPLWFELGPGGPELIESPETASLVPYVPWPHARFSAGMLAWENFIVMAINRDGFLVLEAVADNTAKALLYRVAGNEVWYPYTLESFFIWNGKPAALLYRNDFFSEPLVSSLQPQVFVLDRSHSIPQGARIPALERFPPGDSWETELLRRGPDGLWYYRMKEKGKLQNETVYFRTRDLAGEGEEITVQEWRDSDLPEGPENTAPLLSALLEDAARLGLGEAGAGPALVARTISTDFEGPRFFCSTASAVGAETMALLYAYSRETPESLALAVLPDGRGLYSRGPGPAIFRTLSLPSLPEGFVYTGIALLGDVILASWEEQQEAAIATAGFMVMIVPWRLNIP